MNKDEKYNEMFYKTNLANEILTRLQRMDLDWKKAPTETTIQYYAKVVLKSAEQKGVVRIDDDETIKRIIGNVIHYNL